MKYQVQKLDKRFRYFKWFEYYVGFSNSMPRDAGPLHFNEAHRWMIQTYGWSAEILLYENMFEWACVNPSRYVKNAKRFDLPADCNAHWSWATTTPDLRIYLAGSEELAFFKLAHPNEK